jgi:hypothetical protein
MAGDMRKNMAGDMRKNMAIGSEKKHGYRQ